MAVRCVRRGGPCGPARGGGRAQGPRLRWPSRCCCAPDISCYWRLVAARLLDVAREISRPVNSLLFTGGSLESAGEIRNPLRRGHRDQRAGGSAPAGAKPVPPFGRTNPIFSNENNDPPNHPYPFLSR